MHDATFVSGSYDLLRFVVGLSHALLAAIEPVFTGSLLLGLEMWSRD